MDLSGSVDGERLAKALGPIARQAKAMNADWLMIGAEARDLVLLKHGASPSSRRTFDVDAAICLASWEQFAELKDRLVESEEAHFDGDSPHRALLANNVRVDLVPFGPIAPDGRLEWPDPSTETLDTSGLQEFATRTFEVRLTPDISVHVPELEGLLCLKLIAWRDRHLDRPDHDAPDLRVLLECADLVIHDDTVYDGEGERLEANDYDPELTKLELLGTRLSRALKPGTKSALVELLRGELDVNGRQALVRELRDLARPADWLAALLRGIEPPAP